MILNVLDARNRHILIEVSHKLWNVDEVTAVEALEITGPFAVQQKMSALLADVRCRVVTVRTRDDESETVFFYLLLVQRMCECPETQNQCTERRAICLLLM